MVVVVIVEREIRYDVKVYFGMKATAKVFLSILEKIEENKLKFQEEAVGEEIHSPVKEESTKFISGRRNF